MINAPSESKYSEFSFDLFLKIRIQEAEKWFFKNHCDNRIRKMRFAVREGAYTRNFHEAVN